VDIENYHASSGHLDTYTSNLSSSVRFDAKQADSQDGRKAFKDDRFHKGDRRTSLVHDSKESTNSFGERSGRSMKKKRMLVVGLVVLVMGMISPFGWSYLHSYESTDDAQIDGHMGRSVPASMALS